MKIDAQIAALMPFGMTLLHRSARNADGTPQRWRVNGKVKIWKRSGKWQLPVKRGLYEFGYVTPENADEFSFDPHDLRL